MFNFIYLNMYTCNHVLLIHTRAWHDHRMQAVFDPDLTLQYFPPHNVLPAACPGNVPIHRSRGSDAKEDGWQFAWQDTCSRTETFFKSLQSSRTSTFGENSSKMLCSAIRRMPCPKSFISKSSYPIPSVLPLKKSLWNNSPQSFLFAANKEPPCQEFLRLL